MTAGLYVATFVLAEENRWFGPENPQYVRESERIPVRTETQYYLQLQLYPARDRQKAYDIAASWVRGFDDMNHDGEGELTVFYSLGIFDVQEVIHSRDAIDAGLDDVYGLDVGTFKCAEIGLKEMPRVRRMEELSIFQYGRAMDWTPPSI